MGSERYRQVELRLDTKATICIMMNDEDITHQHAMEVLQFRELCNQDWRRPVKHTYREGNHTTGYPLRRI
ncbi:hypothetical protein LINPERHAP1_LOCUS38448 [Linum perenne]